MKSLQKVLSSIIAYKFLIIFFISILVIGGGLVEARKYLIDKTQVVPTDNSLFGDSAISNNPTDTPEPLIDTPTPEDKSVLGISTVSKKNNSYGGETTLLTVTPFPTMIPNPTAIPTLVPLPTIVPNLSTPTPTAAPTQAPSPHSCAGLNASPGQPVFYYSETSDSQSVNNTATITVDLRDCNNNSAPVSDTLTINQSSGPNTAINGDNTPPVSVETSNGKASFIVSSQTSGTAIYTVTDTTHSFNVTDSNNHNPQVTFTISSPTSTPTPTSGPTPTPTSVPSVTTTPTPTLSVTPTKSLTPTITLTITPTPTKIP